MDCVCVAFTVTAVVLELSLFVGWLWGSRGVLVFCLLFVFYIYKYIKLVGEIWSWLSIQTGPSSEACKRHLQVYKYIHRCSPLLFLRLVDHKIFALMVLFSSRPFV